MSGPPRSRSSSGRDRRRRTGSGEDPPPLIPFLFLLYIAAYRDRINVGFAALVVNSVGNTGGFVGPNLLGALNDATGSFALGLCAIAAMLGAGGLLVLAVSDRR